MSLISVNCLHNDLISQAKKFAEENSLALGKAASLGCAYELCFSMDGTYILDLKEKAKTKIQADFISGSVGHRRKFGGGKGQDIAKAVGLNKGVTPTVMDLTAGMGKDAFVLASLGCDMQLYERSPIVHLLLSDGLKRAKEYAEIAEDEQPLLDIINRMRLSHCDSLQTDGEVTEQVNVVYLDPMFPERTKSAQVKKEMRAFHELVGKDEDADDLLPLALNLAENRVVVKRPKIAPFIAGKDPSFQIVGKSSRFDIYTKKAFGGA